MRRRQTEDGWKVRTENDRVVCSKNGVGLTG